MQWSYHETYKSFKRNTIIEESFFSMFYDGYEILVETLLYQTMCY
jgi:hypothetical protein